MIEAGEVIKLPKDPLPVPEILDEKILYQQGTFSRVRRYLAGWHPELGILHIGWQGPETIVERDIITPKCVLIVEVDKLGSDIVR